MSILEEAIHASRMRRRDVRCFRYVQATPAGVHETAEEVIILQSVRDRAPGSAEKLVLLDHEIHFHPLRGRLLVPAATSRKVLKVNRSLHRDQALMLTGLLEYCQLQQDRCIIHEDNELWAAGDIRVHQMAHGMYIRIQVPPPLDPDLDTEIAIGLARDLVTEDEPERNEVAAQCQQRNVQLSLRQISAAFQIDAHNWELRPDGPTAVTPNRPLPVRVPHGTFAPGHESRLMRLRDEADLIECEEEGRITYVTVRHIHHRQRPRCYEGRSVRLQSFQSHIDTWRDDIVQAWEYEIDRDLPYILQVVAPTPPCSTIASKCTSSLSRRSGSNMWSAW